MTSGSAITSKTVTRSAKQRAPINSCPQNAATVSYLRVIAVAEVESFSGKAVDVWALGVTLYCMIFNQLPYWDETEFVLFEKILKEPL